MPHTIEITMPDLPGAKLDVEIAATLEIPAGDAHTPLPQGYALIHFGGVCVRIDTQGRWLLIPSEVRGDDRAVMTGEGQPIPFELDPAEARSEPPTPSSP